MATYAIYGVLAVCVNGTVLVIGSLGGGSGVSVGGAGASVGGTGVSVGGTGVSVGGADVAVGGTGVSVGGTSVSVGSGVAVGVFGGIVVRVAVTVGRTRVGFLVGTAGTTSD